MHPIFNQGHLEARVSCLMKKLADDPLVRYPDVAYDSCPRRTTMVTFDYVSRISTVATTDANKIQTAEALAIVFAATTQDKLLHIPVVSDSQQPMPPLPRRSSPTPGYSSPPTSTRRDHHHDYLDSRALRPSREQRLFTPGHSPSMAK